MIKIIGFVAVMIIVYSAGAFGLYEAGKYFDSINNSEISHDEINNFKDCVASGYSIIQIYPRICVDENGKTYTEEIE